MYLYDLIRFGLVLVVWRVSVRAETWGAGAGLWFMVMTYVWLMNTFYGLWFWSRLLFSLLVKVYGFGLIVLGYGLGLGYR